MTSGAPYTAFAEICLPALLLSTLHVVIRGLYVLVAGGADFDFRLLVFAMPPLEVVAIVACRVEEYACLATEILAPDHGCNRTNRLDII